MDTIFAFADSHEQLELEYEGYDIVWLLQTKFFGLIAEMRRTEW